MGSEEAAMAAGSRGGKPAAGVAAGGTFRVEGWGQGCLFLFFFERYN